MLSIAYSYTFFSNALPFIFLDTITFLVYCHTEEEAFPVKKKLKGRSGGNVKPSLLGIQADGGT